MSESSFNFYGDVGVPTDDFLYGQEAGNNDDDSVFENEENKKDNSEEKLSNDLVENDNKDHQKNDEREEAPMPSTGSQVATETKEELEKGEAMEPAQSTESRADLGASVSGVSDTSIEPHVAIEQPLVNLKPEPEVDMRMAMSRTHNDTPVPPEQVNAPQPRALILEGLSWWTTDEDLTLAVAEAGVLNELVTSEMGFNEHRVNGKSKGICFIPFKTPEACLKASDFFERIEIHGRKPVVRFAPAHQQHNPFRALPRDPKQIRLESASRRSQQSNMGGAIQGPLYYNSMRPGINPGHSNPQQNQQAYSAIHSGARIPKVVPQGGAFLPTNVAQGQRIPGGGASAMYMNPNPRYNRQYNMQKKMTDGVYHDLQPQQFQYAAGNAPNMRNLGPGIGVNNATIKDMNNPQVGEYFDRDNYGQMPSGNYQQSEHEEENWTQEGSANSQGQPVSRMSFPKNASKNGPPSRHYEDDFAQEDDLNSSSGGTSKSHSKRSAHSLNFDKYHPQRENRESRKPRVSKDGEIHYKGRSSSNNQTDETYVSREGPTNSKHGQHESRRLYKKGEDNPENNQAHRSSRISGKIQAEKDTEAISKNGDTPKEDYQSKFKSKYSKKSRGITQKKFGGKEGEHGNLRRSPSNDENCSPSSRTESACGKNDLQKSDSREWDWKLQGRNSRSKYKGPPSPKNSGQSANHDSGKEISYEASGEQDYRKFRQAAQTPCSSLGSRMKRKAPIQEDNKRESDSAKTPRYDPIPEEEAKKSFSHVRLKPSRLSEPSGSDNLPPPQESPTWSQPYRPKKKSSKDWSRYNEKSSSKYTDPHSTRMGISFIRSSTESKYPKGKSAGAERNYKGPWESREHERNRYSTGLKDRRSK